MTEAENVAAPTQPSLEDKIVKQLEYYFGNINLPKDKFLQEKLKQDDGWVQLTVLLTFNRLSNLSKDVDVIAKAVKDSGSEIVDVSEDGQKIRRNVGNPLPENSLEYWQKIKHTTVYMKGFPTDTQLDAIMEFGKNYGQVENVLMRRVKGEDKIFKGSVFVTYKTREEAEVAQKSEDKFNDTELVKMMQDDYWTLKSKETKERRTTDKNAKLGKKLADNAEAENAKNQVVYTKGMILAIDGLGESASIVSLKEFFNQHGSVAYVAWEHGQSGAEIRFNGDENAASGAWEKAVAAGTDGKVLIAGKEISGRVLDGEDEEKYWVAFNQNKMNAARRDGQGGRGRGGRGRGGRGRGRGNFRGGRGGGRGDYGNKRSAEGDSGPVEAKVAKTEMVVKTE